MRTLVEQATVISSLEGDVWHAFVFTLIKDTPLLAKDDLEHRFRFGLITFLTVCNALAQASLMSWLWAYMVRPSIMEVQELYSQFHATSFDENGSFSEERFAEDFGDSRVRLCRLPLSNAGFLYLALFFWVAQCVNQVCGVGRLAWRVLRQLPSLPPKAPLRLQIVPGETEEEYIICLSPVSRVAILAVACLPKFLLLGCLAAIGCAWLIAARSFDELVFQSLALAFFLDLEELVFAFLMPDRAVAHMERTHFACPGEANRLMSEREAQHDDQMFREYARSFLLLLAVAISVGILLVGQQVVPNFQWDVEPHCQETWQTHSSPWCRPWDTECFPYGKSSA